MFDSPSAPHMLPICFPRPLFYPPQSTRIIERLNEVKDDLAKYGMLRALQDRNEVLFYHVLSKHVRERACSFPAHTLVFQTSPKTALTWNNHIHAFCANATVFVCTLVHNASFHASTELRAPRIPADCPFVLILPICTICTHHLRSSSRQIEEFAKIIYTPVVGRACQSFAHIFRRTRGMYFSSNDRDNMASMVYNWPVRVEWVVFSLFQSSQSVVSVSSLCVRHLLRAQSQHIL